MTERTIRMTAKQLAGQFYEAKRSGQFRGPDTLCRAKRLKQKPDGTAVEVAVVVPFRVAYPTVDSYVNAHWPHFVEAARGCLTSMLGLSTVHDNLKSAIYDAIIEDRTKQISGKNLAPNGGSLLQQKVTDHGA